MTRPIPPERSSHVTRPARPVPAGWAVAMAEALDEARSAVRHADVPVGAVVLGPDGRVLSRAHNEREIRRDPTAHAEILALREAAARLSDEVVAAGTDPAAGGPVTSDARPGTGGWRLSGCTLVVTLEPCAMCAGAMVAARLDRCVFGAWDEKAGACGSVWDLARDPLSLHRVDVVAGVAAAEAAALLRAFFR